MQVLPTDCQAYTQGVYSLSPNIRLVSSISRTRGNPIFEFPVIGSNAGNVSVLAVTSRAADNI